MKLLIEPKEKEDINTEHIDGLILALEGVSVQSSCYYTKEEIHAIRQKNKEIEIFIKMNQNFLNQDLKELKESLQFLEQENIQGIFFYDLAVLQLKKELNLSINLVWDQTHMVNNKETCNYYYQKGVQYALLGKEITLEEILEIAKESPISCMIEVVGLPTVAFSRRKLITNYYKELHTEGENSLEITEKITNKPYYLKEEKAGTSFFLKEVINGTGVIKNLFQAEVPYIIMRELGLEKETWTELLIDTKKYLEGNCQDQNYIRKYQKLGENTNFFFRKTIYQVKKNG